MTDYAARAHWGDYWPPDFGWPPDAFGSAVTGNLVAFSHRGVTFGKMNKDVVKLYTAFLDELIDSGAVRGVAKGGKFIAGQVGCYNPASTLPDGSPSFHVWAIAVDLNWGVNHMGDNLPDPVGPGSIDHAKAHAIARKYGLEYGGDWDGFKDYMHFECHLSPADARAFVPPPPATHPLMEVDVPTLYRKKTGPAKVLLVDHFGVIELDGSVEVHKGSLVDITINDADYKQIRELVKPRAAPYPI